MVIPAVSAGLHCGLIVPQCRVTISTVIPAVSAGLHCGCGDPPQVQGGQEVVIPAVSGASRMSGV